MRALSRLLALVGLVGILTACLPTAPPAGTAANSVASYRAADRAEVLERGATSEGRLVLYTALGGPVVQALSAALEAKYPFMKVDAFRGSTVELQAKLSEEQQAGRPVADLVESSTSSLAFLRESGLLGPFHSPAAATFPPTALVEAGDGLVYAVTTRESYIGLGYNTNLIRDEDAPRTYADLLKPELKGKLAISGSETGLRFLGNLQTFQSDDLLLRFAAQQPAVQMVSGPALLDLVISGEVAASPTIYRNHVQLALAKGTPVRWVPLEPVTAISGGIGLAARAPHPHAALLAADFILSPEGHDLLARHEYASPTDPAPFRRWNPEQGRTSAQFQESFAQWESLLRDRFQRR